MGFDYNDTTGRAAVFCGHDKPFALRSYPVTPPKKGYALLRIIASGVCGTDIHIWRDRLHIEPPLIIGHEFIGEIIDTNGSDPSLKIEDRVVFNMASPCGKCKLCLEGDSANCLAFEVAYAHDPADEPHFFGGYGEYVYAKADTGDGALIKLPEGVPPLAAAMFPCAGPTIIHALKLGGIFAGARKIESAVVQGAGPLGLFSALWLSLMGVKNIYTILRDKNGGRAEKVKELTRSQIINEAELDAMCASGFAADLAVECSGSPAAFAAGCKMLRNRGIYLVPGQYSDSGTVAFGPQVITFKALQIFGSSQYDASDVADYIAFLDNNRPILPDIAACVKTFPLNKVNEALEAAEKHLYSKVALTGPEKSEK